MDIVGSSGMKFISRQDLVEYLVCPYLYILLLLLIAYQIHSDFLITVTTTTVTVFDADDEMISIVKLLFIEHAMQLANALANQPLPRTPVFDVRYNLKLTQSLDHQTSLETVCLVSVNCPQLKWRLNSSPGLPMAPDFPNMTVWVFWRHVLGVVNFFFFLVVILLPAHT
jgi:hypothetical protein